MITILSEVAQTLQSAAPTFPLFSWSTADRFLREGGPLMFVNLAALALALGVAVERAVVLRLRFDRDPRPFAQQIAKLLEAGNRERAVQLCAAMQKTPLARVMHAALTQGGTQEERDLAVERALSAQRPFFEERIGWLWSLANVATLIGIVGTGWGIIETFHALGDVNPGEKEKLLGEGIARAMNNTALALTIAVACVLGHLAVKAYAGRLFQRLTKQVARLRSRVASRSGELAAPQPT